MSKYQCLDSVPSVGPFYAVGIIANTGQIQRFDNHTKIAKYASLFWKQNQSRNRHLRYYLDEAANSIRNHEPEFNAYYRKK